MKSITLSAIATRVGYSKNTVSLALRDSTVIPRSTRELIQKAADEMGYRPNAVLSHLMAQLRNNQTANFQAKLALVNAYDQADAFRTHPTIPSYVRGCQRRAAKLGYDFDQFWLHDPELRPESWIRILRTRSIKGIIVVGLMGQNRLPPHLVSVWEQFPTVVTGVRTRDPALSFCAADHHNLTVAAFEQALQLGYRRPALVLENRLDRLVEGRFCGAFLSSQQALPVRDRIAPFLQVAEARTKPNVFHRWFGRHRPDVILTLNNIVLSWLKAAVVRVPREVGIIHLEWNAEHPEFAGMNQHNDVVGEAAVDMLIAQIHHNESGVPAFPRATLVGATWVSGPSVRAPVIARRRAKSVSSR